MAEAEADDLREQSEATEYAAVSVRGRVLYRGTDEGAAIQAARAHFWRTYEHVGISNSAWSTTRNGFGERRDGTVFPNPERVRAVNAAAVGTHP